MSSSSNRICLKWNDFQHNTVSYLKELRIGTNFSDVTLVCEGNQQIKAHKIVLTACSPFFSSILNTNTHSHPMIYMRGVMAKHLGAIVDFIYHGEANIHEEDINEFLALANEFQLKGLAGSENKSFYQNNENFMSGIKSKSGRKKGKRGRNEARVKGRRENKQEEEKYVKENKDQMIVEQDDREEDETSIGEHLLVPLNGEKVTIASDITKEDFEIKIMSLMEIVDDGFSNWKCKLCGKKTQVHTRKNDMKRHIESHLEGKTYSCNLCGKSSRTTNALHVHLSKYHKETN